MKKIFKDVETDAGGKHEGNVFKVSSPKLLISCRLHIYKESQFQRITLLTKNECNLLSPELCLLEDERMHMLQKYLPVDIINNIGEVTENFDYFPLLCKLSKDKTSVEVKKLFTAPLTSIKKTINNIIHENKEQFCALTLCIILRDGFNKDWVKKGSVSVNKTYKLDDIVKEFDIDLGKEKQRNSLKAGFSTLHGTYLKMRGTEYRMTHDKIYKMAAVICGKHLTGCFIKYAHAKFIRDNFIFESLTEIQEKDDLIVLLKDQEEDYFERLLSDIKERVFTSTFNNYQLISQTFRDKLISFLRKSDVKTVLKSFDTRCCIFEINYDYRVKTKYMFCKTPLLELATKGYFDIVEFLIVTVKLDVNKTDESGNSPLYKASENGQSAVVKLLLENNADVNQCNNYKLSPLHVACRGEHKHIVELLLQYNADVNTHGYLDGESPLFMACEEGYKNIIELLLSKNADVNLCKENGMSPLYVACKGGHNDTVELLLQNNADVNQFDVIGVSALYLACAGGHTEIVKLLIQYNVDVSQCGVDGESLLCLACKAGHTDLVELLLQKNGDVNQCYTNVMSPLYAASARGHKDIVELLHQNNADVNQCDEIDISPLHVACGGEHKDKVDMLLHYSSVANADDFLHGEFPLYMACKGGYKDIVELLLQNKADINQCTDNAMSPLFVACKWGHRDTVEMLLHNNADVNKCNNNRCSPLHVACERGHKDTAELLLQNNADVFQCDSKGDSPLHAVCSYQLTLYSLRFGNFSKSFLDQKRETVKLLLEWNADVKISNKKGQTSLDIAREAKFVEVVNILEENFK